MSTTTSTTTTTTTTTAAAAAATIKVNAQHNNNNSSRSHCTAEKENNDMLSPPLTPKEDSHHDPAVVCCPNHHNRKGFIQAYAQMVPHLRPVESRMYGKQNKPVTATRYSSSSPSSIDDWLAAHHSEKHQQIFTFDLCKLLAPLRQSKRKRQQQDDLEEEDQEKEEASLSSSSDDTSSVTTTLSSSSSHEKTATTVSRKKKKSKTAATTTNTTPVITNKSNHNSNSCSEESQHHRTSNGGKAPARRNTRDLSIKGFTIDPQYTFDNIDIDAQDQDFYPQGWLPSTDRLDHVPVDINWKGKPLKLDANDPYFGRLHHIEAEVISHMRLSPQLYLRCKRAIIMAAREFSMHGLEFRKSDAQKVCRIDVNKSSRLWAAFNVFGWLKPNATTITTTFSAART